MVCDMDLRKYFEKHAPEHSPEAEAWSRALDALLQNGVGTVREFRAMGAERLLCAFVSEKDDVKGLDHSGFELAWDMYLAK